MKEEYNDKEVDSGMTSREVEVFAPTTVSYVCSYCFIRDTIPHSHRGNHTCSHLQASADVDIRALLDQELKLSVTLISVCETQICRHDKVEPFCHDSPPAHDY